MVCAASHLKSPIAQEIFRKNTFLLKEGHVTPALRESVESIHEAFRVSTDSPFVATEDVAKFYDEHVADVVTWNLEENSNWFRDRFIEELRNPRSVVRLNAKGLTEESVSEFIALSAGKPLIDRQLVTTWTQSMDSEDRDVLLAFRELIYHVSGARVVNCEGSLPQEEYLDFDLTDLSQKRTRLNDEMVFWKIFVEQALHTLQMRSLPVELLDVLDFADVLAIRQPLLDSDFQAKYDELTRTAISLAREGAPLLVESVERLEVIRSGIEKTFNEIFDKELPHFIRKKSRVSAQELVSNSVSVGLGLLGLIPGVGTAASAISLAKDSTALYFNVVDFRATPQSLLEVVARREEAIRKLATRRPLEETLMYDMVDLLFSTIRERIKLA